MCGKEAFLEPFFGRNGGYEAHSSLPTMVVGMYTSLYMPSLLLVGVPALYLPVYPSGDRPVHEGRSGPLCTSCADVEEAKLCEEEERLFSLRNIPSPARKPA